MASPFRPAATPFRGALLAAALLALAAIAPARAIASTLYVATARSYVAVGNAIGRLYEVDPSTGKPKALGDLRIGQTPIGVNGIARDPKSGKLFGTTLPSSPGFPSHLVTIDTANGAATVVGPMGAAVSDINFDAQGRLFAWLSDQRRVAQVDTATGKVTAIDIPGLAGESGGLAIDRSGIAYLAVTSGAGKLARIDLENHRILGEVPLTDTPLKGSLNSLTFSPEGKLVGVNSDNALPPRTLLVAIDTASGRVTTVGDLPQDADGLTYMIDAPGAVAAEQKFQWVPWAAGGAVVVVLIAIAARRRRGKPV